MGHEERGQQRLVIFTLLELLACAGPTWDSRESREHGVESEGRDRSGAGHRDRHGQGRHVLSESSTQSADDR